ncbi:hypothetical protein CY34DRAFT_811134 [Suillus luteus UH-Slu-Lm8-n1]|uniref:Uncharacterized protein n=1 Tax=Suillus luteus UH-Slu-Lm8-n1 TaxID=930992 RepID=A0A0D0AXP7_9AGAM|nr:hypothetical protein CY34DRAFT_811134 [Suillus luteus UH-Slu-Lm8-n1]
MGSCGYLASDHPTRLGSVCGHKYSRILFIPDAVYLGGASSHTSIISVQLRILGLWPPSFN